jgi:hypothetical protein
MIYAQFYQRAAIAPYHLIECCGDRGVIILDGRKRVAFNVLIAMDECKRRGFLAVEVRAADSFLDDSPKVLHYAEVQA